jgi:hypothetical protein
MSKPYRESDTDGLVARLRAEASAFPYPPTPDLAARTRVPTRSQARGRQRLLRIAMVAALVLAALLAVPEVRAAALRIIQIGAVRVRIQPGPAPTALAPATPQPTPDLGLVGAIPVEEAATRVSFPVRLPAYPPELGAPDLAFLQDLDGDALVFVWLDPANPSQPLMSLHALTSGALVQKTLFGPETELLDEAEVNGARALWVRGPHFLEGGRGADGGFELRRIVPGNTLIWTAGELTYRLETAMPLEEALRVAESLR